MFVENFEEVVIILDLLALDAHDDVTKFNIALFRLYGAAQTGISGAATRLHLQNQHAIGDGHANLICQRRDIARDNAKLGPAHFATANQLRNDAFSNAHRNRESDSSRRAGW